MMASMRDRYDDEELLTREAAADGGEVEEGDELYEHFAVSVDAGQEPMRLDKFLALRMQHCSRNRIQTATDNGNVLVNGRAAKPSYRVKPLDRITLEAILRTLKAYNLARPLDRLTEEEAKIEIYPTVILALPDNVLKASRDETAAALDKYRKAGEEDDV